MGKRNFVFSIHENYHLYNRGVDKRKIFLDSKDRERFIRLLFLCNNKDAVVYKETKDLPLTKITVNQKLVAIGAYCLMPNHFHILIQEIDEGGVVKFMSKLLTAYSSYFNKKYERTGALFGSEFQATHLSTDAYLKYIYSYIHLNLLKIFNPKWKESFLNRKGVLETLNKYSYSSYSDYSGHARDEKIILNKSVFPQYFDSAQNFTDNILDWIQHNPDELQIQGQSLD